MKLLMKMSNGYLIPSSSDSVENYEKLKEGQEYNVEVKRARNPQFHRLCFSLIKAMYDNQERFDNFEAFRTELKILCGHYEEYITAKGEIVYIPKSWAFSEMDDLQFHEAFERIKDIATKRFGYEFVQGYL